jgi:hypothetical protein
MPLNDQLTPDEQHALDTMKGINDTTASSYAPLIQQAMTQATQGYNQPVLTAQKEAGMQGINSTMQQAMRNLRIGQGMTNANGGLIGGNQIANNAMQARSGLERDLVAKNADYMSQGLNNWNTINTNANTASQSAAQNYWTMAQNAFNQKNTAQQQYGMGRLASLTGGAGWKSSQDNQAAMLKLQQQMIASMQQPAASSGSESSSTPTSGSAFDEAQKLVP